jgi:hypothetical protein
VHALARCGAAGLACARNGGGGILAFFKERGVSDARSNALVEIGTGMAFLRKSGFGDFLLRMWKQL